ncbi:hypothetical protein GCM10019059_30450 [Camelimonas fluminis]|uniref:Outer membrane protein with glycine zipper n=1 Tax=Camelimonas fluminis TaxID=1576911 RepID=A0ABV7UKF4_9HYPH|nr:hypothetical protein [Camelimonas fluminis]GHE68595.1 hypothetical protein GCM10019059_30450 [Camelimonas fluminis]
MAGAEQNDNVSYQEREAVAVFDSEQALRSAVDALMQIGLRQDDLSLLGDVSLLHNLGNVKQIEDAGDVKHAAYVSSDERTEGLSAIVGAPAYVIGAGAAAIVATGGAALIPTIAVTAGGAAVGGALGLLLARAFGRKHADRVGSQIAAGGLLLWVHAPDPEKDAAIIAALSRNGGRDVHIHVVERSWGPADAPLHDFNPDPLLEKS